MKPHLPAAALLLTLFCPAALLAQPAPAKPVFALPQESIIVTATKPSDTAIKSFVETRAAPTYILGRMARWTSKICPLTIGLGGTYTKYLTQRIRDIAAAAGAPVNEDPGCRPNIEVVFTTTPQGLMDNVRQHQPLFLGYYHNNGEADALAKVTHPIQAWYTTVSQDMDGSRQVDTGTCGMNGMTRLNTMTNAQPAMPGEAATTGVYQLSLPCAIVLHVTGFRARDGLNSGFFNVLIVAEPAKLFDYEVGSLADYITMLALSQPASLDSCQELPSISNLLANGCASAASKITDGDLAYLHALYKLPNGELLAAQRDYIRYEMKKTLVTDKSG